MSFSKTGLAVAICAVFTACSSGPTEEEIAVKVDDFRQRSAQYFNARRYIQAYQQAELGLELAPSDDGELNLLAGHALMMMRNLNDVAKSEAYLLKAQDALNSYRADLILGEYHQRYGAMLNSHARRQLKIAEELEEFDDEQRQMDIEENEERIEIANQHFEDAADLFLFALEESPDDLHALQLIGQSYSYLGEHDTARKHLGHAVNLLVESRQYKNRILATNTKINLREESLVRSEMSRDIDTEISIRILLAGLDKLDGNVTAEIEQYSTILELNPDHLDVSYLRGVCYYNTGNIEQAIIDLERFISNTKLPYKHPQVQHSMEITSELK
jgi:tetratricopeptide (TPR) repeat protein